MKHSLILAATAALAMVVAPAVASAKQPHRGNKSGKGFKAKFAKLDKNGDGSLTVQEFSGNRMAKRFARLDKNNDGYLTRAEFKNSRGKNHPGKRKGKNGRWKKLDKNQDGKLSRWEVKGTGLAGRFACLDRNNDGFLTRAELRKGRRGKHPGKRTPAAQPKAPMTPSLYMKPAAVRYTPPAPARSKRTTVVRYRRPAARTVASFRWSGMFRISPLRFTWL